MTPVRKLPIISSENIPTNPNFSTLINHRSLGIQAKRNVAYMTTRAAVREYPNRHNLLLLVATLLYRRTSHSLFVHFWHTHFANGNVCGKFSLAGNVFPDYL